MTREAEDHAALTRAELATVQLIYRHQIVGREVIQILALIA